MSSFLGASHNWYIWSAYPTVSWKKRNGNLLDLVNQYKVGIVTVRSTTENVVLNECVHGTNPRSWYIPAEKVVAKRYTMCTMTVETVPLTMTTLNSADIMCKLRTYVEKCIDITTTTEAMLFPTNLHAVSLSQRAFDVVHTPSFLEDLATSEGWKIVQPLSIDYIEISPNMKPDAVVVISE
nr:hypothetical protein [Microctonus hyperodae filamentous virus]